MDALEPFLPDLDISPDHTLADIEAEIKMHSQMQRLIQSFLKGETGLDVLDDCLAQYGINPHEYWGVVDENIEAAIEEETVLENSLILLPLSI